jgi:pimeloyl-ACP methyl ester carboxylesterase
MEFLAKSMPYGFQRRGDPGSWTAFRLGTFSGRVDCGGACDPQSLASEIAGCIASKAPGLVLWGAEDKLLPVRCADVWRTEVPGAKVEIIPACGHLLHVEKAEVAANRILAFTDGDGQVGAFTLRLLQKDFRAANNFSNAAVK